MIPVFRNCLMFYRRLFDASLDADFTGKRHTEVPSALT
jgi:hypothetical protein